MSWWWCLNHRAAEPDIGCAHKDRLGPYNSQEAAEAALPAAAQRSHDWDDEDEQWMNPPGP